MEKGNHPQLVVPALRAHMGDWFYYVAVMKLAEVARRVRLAEELHTSKTLNELIQRQVTARSEEIKKYLLTQKQRLFNALVVGVYDGAPRWHELALRKSVRFDPSGLPADLDGILGVLVLRGDEKFFAIDGQHRVVGIKAAVEGSSKIGEEEVTAIFVAHRNDASGLQRTRRLFTTLNRYAKPVSKKDIIALDEDDVVAIVTRRLLDSHPLLKDRVSETKTRHIPVSDKRNFTTMVFVYDATEVIIISPGRSARQFKAFRPSEEEIDRMYRVARKFWDSIVANVEAVHKVARAKPEAGVAGEFRHREGGHLVFRPIGLLLVARVVRALVDSGVTLEEAARRVSHVPMDLAGDPWRGLLWDGTNHRMITATQNQRAAGWFMFHAVGGALERGGTVLGRKGTSTDRLRLELAGLMNRPVEEVTLPQYLE